MYEISRMEGKVRNSISDVDSKSRNMKYKVRDSKGWWKGLAGDTFRDEWRRFDADTNKLMKELRSLKNDIKKLDQSVDRADRERRAEERRKKQLANSSSQSSLK